MKAKKAQNPEQHLIPYLLYKDVGAALKFLTRAFGFRENGDRFTAGDGTISHAAMELKKGGEVFMMGCPGAAYRNPKKLGSTTQMLYIHVDNVDRHYARARKAGAKIIGKLEDTFYGDRRYGALDPEGHQWFFAQHVRDVSSDEMQKAALKRK